jgi:Mpv17 / PMP22 family
MMARQWFYQPPTKRYPPTNQLLRCVCREGGGGGSNHRFSGAAAPTTKMGHHLLHHQRRHPPQQQFYDYRFNNNSNSGSGDSYRFRKDDSSMFTTAILRTPIRKYPWYTSTTTTNMTHASSFSTVKRSNAGVTTHHTTIHPTTTTIVPPPPQQQQPPPSLSAYIPFLQSFIAWYSLRLDTHPFLIKGITSGLIALSGDLLCQSVLRQLELPPEEAVPPQQQQQMENRSDHTFGTMNSVATTTTSVQQPGEHMQPNHDHTDSPVTLSSSSSSSTWDGWRTLRFGLLGMFYVAPGCHIWYGWLAQWYPILPNKHHQYQYLPLLKRVVADQFLFTPIFLIGWLSCLWTLEYSMPPMLTTTMATADNNTNTTTTDTRVATTTTIPKGSTTRFDVYYYEKWTHTNLYQILVANWMLWIPVQTCNFHFIPTKYQVLVSNCVALVWNTYLSYVTSSTTTAAASHSYTTISDHRNVSSPPTTTTTTTKEVETTKQ